MVEKIKTLLTTILPTWSGFVPSPVATSCILMKSNSMREYTTLNSFTKLYDHLFEVEIITNQYSDLINYFMQVKNLIESIQFTTQTYYIQEVIIEDFAPESWDAENKLNHKLLTFTVSYQK